MLINLQVSNQFSERILGVDEDNIQSTLEEIFNNEWTSQVSLLDHSGNVIMTYFWHNMIGMLNEDGTYYTLGQEIVNDYTAYLLT